MEGLLAAFGTEAVPTAPSTFAQPHRHGSPTDRGWKLEVQPGEHGQAGCPAAAESSVQGFSSSSEEYSQDEFVTSAVAAPATTDAVGRWS